jgi:phosphatidylserine/phosphatidylglycerophosphate/cardiolipin synthase-like enzyme
VPAAAVPATALALLATARSACVELYELGNPALIAALVALHARGRPVTVVLDGTEAQSAAAARVLAAAGVPVRLVRLADGGLDHVKLLVINHRTVLAGGVNWGVASTATTDADVLLPDDPAGAAACAADWRTAAHPPATGAWPDPTGPGSLSGAAISAALARLVAQAAGPVDVAANYLTDWGVQDDLAAAARRGDPVRVILNPAAFGAATAARWLTAHGVTVRWAPRTPYLHAKVILTPTGGLVGSANFSFDALHARNHEFDVQIPPALLPAARAWFARLWAASTPAS